eukprot:Blabericola_migrator_1__8556@NODE_4473_length_1137_cov_611_434579_g2770_i0_p1_GENE_NODE_4473_length_1137_cov_611_434579_g2770_i0NODE_4473_length_1137_cov_611_434579_g2770_i0_p1_ORF_typecomplete_len236_score37_69Pollen_Ole_e_I/PF01190_17/0_31Pollen_Ole_e_I/PF01190_17/1_4e03_NODE_4473_length_1137_cov_611_434579_g2770_i03751082
MRSVFALIALSPVVFAALEITDSVNTPSAECPEACQKAKFASFEEIAACNNAVAANATSTCTSVGSYKISGDDTLTYKCNQEDKTNSYGYYTVTLSSLETAVGTLSNTVLTLKEAVKADCILYTAPLLTTELATTCNIDTAKVDLTGTAYITTKADGSGELALPADLTGPQYLVSSQAHYANCVTLKDKVVGVSADATVKIVGKEAVETPEVPTDYSHQVLALSGACFVSLAFLN